MATVAHIDGDILVYAGGFAAEKGQYTMKWLDEEGTEHEETFQYKKEVDARAFDLQQPYVLEFSRTPEPVEYALANVKQTIKHIKEALGVTNYVVYLSGGTNFRTEIATIRPYKGNRVKSHKPVHGPAIREYMVNHHPCVMSIDEEADDVIGYTHYAMFKEDHNSTYICTQDKDLNMIPGHHYNFYKREAYYVDEDQADWNFYYQLLLGDRTDNIVGVPKIGEKTAKRILAGLEGDPAMMYQVVELEYIKAYGGDEKVDPAEILLENARLLWIRRKKGELWTPPTMTI